jgi:hypothetical protein
VSDVRELLIKRIAELLKDSDINDLPMFIHVQGAEDILDQVFCDPEVRAQIADVIEENAHIGHLGLGEIFGPVKETT